MKTPYSILHALSRKNTSLQSILSLLDWDLETYMPSEGVDFRSEQMSNLAEIIHKSKVSKPFKTNLQKLISLETGEILDASLSSAQMRAVKAWRRDYLHAAKLPAPFVKKFTEACSTTSHVWIKAKKENSFSTFEPYLEKIVALCKKKAQLLGFKDHPYDALLDIYEPGTTVAFLTPLFARLKPALTALLKQIQAAKSVRTDFLEGDFPKLQQIEFGQKILKAMGFAQSASRLDISAHPFCCGMNPKDTRMTTRIYPHLVLPSILAVLHEGGHGLYNMDLPLSEFGSPLGTQISLGVDESQSRLWETTIGKSLPFWTHFYPELQKTFPQALSSISLKEFYEGINIAQPTFIRVEADEVTYCLHIILRFEMEKAIIEGSLKVKDIPRVWNEKMQESLGITPSTDSEGCLQDIHWSFGSFGYFPTYALGNLYAAQFFKTFEKTHPHWKEGVARGDLSLIHAWLKENIHTHGQYYEAEELIKKITEKPLSEEDYIAYLKKKYKEIYQL